MDTYVNGGVSVDDPHDSGSRVAGNAAAESRAIAFFDLARLGFAYEDRSRADFLFLDFFLGNPVR